MIVIHAQVEVLYSSWLMSTELLIQALPRDVLQAVSHEIHIIERRSQRMFRKGPLTFKMRDIYFAGHTMRSTKAYAEPSATQVLVPKTLAVCHVKRET